MMLDLLIRNGQIYDGEGSDPIPGDVGIAGDRIVGIGNLQSASARQVLDAGGAAVSPGFIDIHSHADLALLGGPTLPPKTLQGVTTEVVGNCGFSPAPTGPTAMPLLRQYVGPVLGGSDLPWTWRSFEEYWSHLEATRTSVNVAAHVGHGALRILAMGFTADASTAEQMATMIRELETSLEAGAAGLSIGLLYAPACFAQSEEIEALCRVVARFGRFLTVHMRNESDTLVESVQENLALARETGVRLHISHLKASGQANWDRMVEVLDLIERARREGIEVTCDQYPYVAGSTTVTALLPPWALEGGVEALLDRLGRREARDRILADYDRGIPGWDCVVRANGWDNIVLNWIGKESLQPFEGKTLAEIGALGGKGAAEALFDLVVEVRGDASIVIFQQSEDNVAAAMRKPFVAVGSDGLHAGVKPHPRLYGTFPRVLGRYVRELATLALPEALRKMTSLPAGLLGQTLRGRLREGCYADVVVFDSRTIADAATFADPVRFPQGIHHVVVNGVPIVLNGQHTGARPGAILRG